MGVAVSAIERSTESMVDLRLELEEQLKKCRSRKAAQARREGRRQRRRGRPNWFGVDTTVLFGGDTPLDIVRGEDNAWDDAAEAGFSGHVAEWYEGQRRGGG